jgi:3-deoxy-D-manno-octulosonate 8-phosphate phosphatase (KDO 8-P phosphatase)
LFYSGRLWELLIIGIFCSLIGLWDLTKFNQPMNVLDLFKKIRCFAFDVDGVLTDGNLLIMENGQWMRKMNIKDGYALQLAVRKGYETIIISGGTSAPVKSRLELLGVRNIYMGVGDKKSVLEDFVMSRELKWEEVLCMGDDMPDYGAMSISGLACAPADAAPDIRKISAYISPFNGGQGCVRDVIEKVLRLNNDWDLETGIASK